MFLFLVVWYCIVWHNKDNIFSIFQIDGIVSFHVLMSPAKIIFGKAVSLFVFVCVHVGAGVFLCSCSSGVCVCVCVCVCQVWVSALKRGCTDGMMRAGAHTHIWKHPATTHALRPWCWGGDPSLFSTLSLSL